MDQRELTNSGEDNLSPQYTEFDLSGGKLKSITRNIDTPEPDSELNQPISTSQEMRHEMETSTAKSTTRDKVNLSVDLEDDDWQEMETANDHEVFGDKGEILVDKFDDPKLRQDDMFATTFGYTKIAAEEQAARYHEADSKTAFLFKSRNGSKTAITEKNNQLYGEDGTEDDSFDDVDDDLFAESHSAADQLNTTKDLLTDSEKLAYVGLVKLVMTDMAASLAKSGVTNTAKSGNSKFVKRMHAAQSSMGFWQVKIMNRIYYHLDIPEEEVKMVDSLVSHNIDPEDLACSLKRTSVIANPVYEKKAESETNEDRNHVEEMKKGIVRPEDAIHEQQLEVDVRWTVICDLFLMLISDSIYDARSRTLLMKFSEYLGIDQLDVYQFERRITEALELEDTSEQVWNEEQILKTRRRLAKRKKYMYVGLATVGGSLVLGLSGGLLAPVIGAGIAAGLSTIGIGGTAGFLAGAGGTTIIALGSTALGARAGSTGMMKRVGDVKTFEFVPLHNNKRTNLIITVSGWINSKSDDVRLPFSTVDPVMGDLYSVLWEPEMLQSMGETIGILASEILTQSVQQLLGATILTALMGALQLPMALSKLKYIIDNPWNVSLDRAWKAGMVLADTLIARNLGERPVTLIGFSIGARVIYSCLLELAKRGAQGLVEDVIVFGAPVVGSSEQLMLARSVVSGRFVNGYSKKDWILGYLFRATSGGLRRVTGLSPIERIEGIENFDCTNLVEGHMGYRTAMPRLLKKMGFRVLSEEFVEIDEPDPEATERQRKLISEFQEARKQLEQEGDTKKKGFLSKWMKPKKKEWWEMYSESRNNSQDTLSRASTAESLGEFDVDRMMDKVENMKLKEEDTSKSDETLEQNFSKSREGLSLAEEDDIIDERTSFDKKDDMKNDRKIEQTQEKVGPANLANAGVPTHKTIEPAPDYDSSSIGKDEEEHEESKDELYDDDDDEFPVTENITMTFG